MNITEFLEARIAEDEKRASYYGMALGTDRVLAECKAKRVILGTYMAVAANKNVEGSVQWYEEKALRTSVDTLAAVYKDHPDYQQAWALEA